MIRRSFVFSVITSLWTLIMVIGAIHAAKVPTNLPQDLNTQLFVGAMAWLDVLSRGGMFHVFVGGSMLLGPIWSVCAWNNSAKISAILAILGTGVAASAVCTNTPLGFSYALGALFAPVVAGFFLVGYFALQTRAAVQKTLGIETDDERRLRIQKEQFAEDRRDFRRRVG